MKLNRNELESFLTSEQHSEMDEEHEGELYTDYGTVVVVREKKVPRVRKFKEGAIERATQGSKAHKTRDRRVQRAVRHGEVSIVPVREEEDRSQYRQRQRFGEDEDDDE